MKLFISPQQADENAPQAVAAAAKEMNPLISQGRRVFTVPAGIADAIADELRAETWHVTVKPGDDMSTITLSKVAKAPHYPRNRGDGSIANDTNGASKEAAAERPDVGEGGQPDA